MAARPGTARKATGTVAKSTPRNTSVARITTRACNICLVPIKEDDHGKCRDCRVQWEEFQKLLGSGAVKEELFRMYRDLRMRIDEISDLVEIDKIREKYTS